MEKGTTKIIFWSATALILIGGGYYGYTLYDKSQKEKKEKEEQEKKEKEEADKKTTEKEYVNVNVQYGSTGFKTKAEGDAFRKYVIANYPADAKKWDLDPIGSEDNSTIRKAYSFYGEIYKKSLSTSVVLPSTALKVGDYANAKNNTGVYTSNTMVNRYPMGNTTGILSGTLLKGYYAGLIKEIDLNKGSVKVSNGTYQAVDEDGGKHIQYWVKLADLEKN